MAKLTEIGDWLSGALPGLIAEHSVPGAAVAVSAGDDLVESAAGVLSLATGVTATTDSVFQIGSITKVWTATLVMQLVDEGLLELDAPVRRYLPELRLRDEPATAAMTVRQLLCHTAGFEGDIFTDTGKGDDCVAKFVATLGDVPALFPPGEMFSYNNAGYCVLGRVVEVLRGKAYDDCLRQHLIGPLGLAHAATCAEEAILHRAAVGHLRPEPDAQLQPAPVWALMRSNAPAGSTLAMSARDLLDFARMHLRGGAAADGTRVLSGESVAAMRQRQVTLPYLGIMGDAWGLGWELFDWPGGPVIGHDGGTIGQSAFLRVVPGSDVAVALLTNGGDAIALYRAVVGPVLRELTGVVMPDLPAPNGGNGASTRPDATRYVGTYSSSVAETVVRQDPDGRIWAVRTPKGIAEMLGGPETFELVAFRDDTLITVEKDHGLHMPYAFVGDDGRGRARYLHTGRADQRVAQPDEEST
jgi:CubicO group peptidase (beta-lactamase class C family)